MLASGGEGARAGCTIRDAPANRMARILGRPAPGCTDVDLNFGFFAVMGPDRFGNILAAQNMRLDPVGLPTRLATTAPNTTVAAL